MKAVAQRQGGWILVDDSVPTDSEVTYPFEDAQPPTAPEGHIVESAFVLGDDGIVRRVWGTRPLSDAEAQKVIREPQIIWLQLREDERDAIWDAAMAASRSAQRSAARMVLGAMWAAPEVFTRSATTRSLCAVVAAYGWVTAARLEEILGDDGVMAQEGAT